MRLSNSRSFWFSMDYSTPKIMQSSWTIYLSSQLAWACKTSSSHWINRLCTGELNCPAGIILRKFQSTSHNDMHRVCDTGSTIWRSSSRTSQSCQRKPSNNQAEIKRESEGHVIGFQDPYFQPFKLQNTCPGRLPKDYPRVRNHGWI